MVSHRISYSDVLRSKNEGILHTWARPSPHLLLQVVQPYFPFCPLPWKTFTQAYGTSFGASSIIFLFLSHMCNMPCYLNHMQSIDLTMPKRVQYKMPCCIIYSILVCLHVSLVQKYFLCNQLETYIQRVTLKFYHHAVHFVNILVYLVSL